MYVYECMHFYLINQRESHFANSLLPCGHSHLRPSKGHPSQKPMHSDHSLVVLLGIHGTSS